MSIDSSSAVVGVTEKDGKSRATTTAATAACITISDILDRGKLFYPACTLYGEDEDDKADETDPTSRAGKHRKFVNVECDICKEDKLTSCIGIRGSPLAVCVYCMLKDTTSNVGTNSADKTSRRAALFSDTRMMQRMFSTAKV